MNHSGVLSALLQYLTGVETETEPEGGETREKEPEEPRDSLEQVAACEERLRLFLHVFADMPLSSE